MLELKQTHIGELLVLEVTGRVDAINAAQLNQEIQSLINNGLGKNLLLNLAGVDYLSAAGLRVLRTLKDGTGRVCISQPSDRVRDVLQITGLNSSYAMYESQIEALHHLRPVVNAHTHLEHGWLKDSLPDVRGMDFVKWLDERVRQVSRDKRFGDKENFAAAEAGIQAMLAAGITTVGDISKLGMSVQPLLNAGMRGIVYIEVSGRDPLKVDENLLLTRSIIERWRSQMRGGLELGISPHATYSLHPDLWKKVLDYARKEALPLCIHAAESPAEVQYLKDGTGDLADIYYKGETNFPIPNKSPIAYLEDLGALDLKPLLVHTIQVDDADIQRIKNAGARVVHCPRSNLRLRAGRMPLEKFLAAEIPVFLGTDSLASSPSLNIFEEVEVAVALHYDKVQAEQLVSLLHGKL